MINGKIARILSESEVVLNVGSTQGVRDGMEFVIYSTGDPIIDPDSGRTLGLLETVKGRILVSHVMEGACRARTKTHTETLPSPFESIGMSDLFRSRAVRRHATLQVKKEQVQPFAEDLTVRVGDAVRSLPEP
jgi:hypothetical protein